ncbi:hypothetical protein [Mesorhizobium sp.]|uniref:hypothetical protein n=1 Tax=Mesorhizobium sp. TaxID=1871066 RepID=UPI003BA8E939
MTEPARDALNRFLQRQSDPCGRFGESSAAILQVKGEKPAIAAEAEALHSQGADVGNSSVIVFANRSLYSILFD